MSAVRTTNRPSTMRKHGLSYAPEYRAWQTMRHRCTSPESPAWADYGGRGITICDRWLDDPAAFLADMGPKPSPEHEIDRIDNDAGYSPENCRWVTRSENDRNRRSTVWVEYRGERRRLIDLCEQFGVRCDTVKFRIRNGATVEDALETPVKFRAPNGSRPKVEPRWRCTLLTDDQKREAYRLYQSGRHTQAALAERFGCSDSLIGNVVNDARWSS